MLALGKHWGDQGLRALLVRTLFSRVSLRAKLCNPRIGIRHDTWQQGPPAQSPEGFEGKSQLLQCRTRVWRTCFWALQSRWSSRQAAAAQTEAVDQGTRAAAGQQRRATSGFGSTLVVDAMRRARATCGRVEVRLLRLSGQRQ
jgi:hypothetical protein